MVGCQHKITTLKEDGQKDLSALSSFNRVHFNHSNIRIRSDICLKIFVSAADVALLVDPYRFLLFSNAVTDFAWKVAVANRKKTSIDIVVNCLLIQHDQVNVIDTDLVNGLSLFDQRRDDAINSL
mgnify:FL=1